MRLLPRLALPAVVLIAVSGCSAIPGAQPSLDAPAAVRRLATGGVAGDAQASTAESDPNHLLGRPGQYTQRVTFTIPGVKGDNDPTSCQRGGCVEAWPDQASAQRRADYITAIAKGLPAAVEYDTVRSDGLLLRVAGAATPDQAKKVEAAFEAL